jgi:hypothetical protein
MGLDSVSAALVLLRKMHAVPLAFAGEENEMWGIDAQRGPFHPMGRTRSILFEAGCVRVELAEGGNDDALPTQSDGGFIACHLNGALA